MKKFFKALILSVPCVLGVLTGCDKPSDPSSEPTSEPAKELVYAQGTKLKVAAGYQKTNEAISFQDASITGEGLTLADGKTYHTGDLKPTWQFIKDKLGIDFEDKFTGAGSAEKEFNAWDTGEGLDKVDIIAGSASKLNEAGSLDKLVNLAEYLDYMPNFKAYLESNVVARLSITGNTSNGAIYFSPYFDGVDDIERMPLMRADFVRTLLDGTTAYTGQNRPLQGYKYTPYMPTSGQVKVQSLTSDGKGTQEITKDYSKYGNIVAKMNASTDLKGDQAVAMFREYIDKTYAGQFTNRSDLFLGYNACWDADEMVALLRCAVASLNDDDGNPISGLYSRETNNMQRDVDMFRFAGSLFGVRGLESRKDYLYFDKDGNLHDARQEAESYEACLRMNQLVQEGLLQVDGKQTSTNYLEKDAGLMSYDYNQTQTIMNDTKLNKSGDTGEEYVAVMVPVAKWNDGSGDAYFRFTESWRSVKTDGWAITKAGAGADENKLHAALKLIDFAFSVQGQITMSYGSDAFIKVKDASVEVNTWEDVAKKYETFNFNGVQMPVIADGTKENLKTLTSGNYTNFARRYLGSTLNGFPKSQAFEYQCTSETGKKGSAVLSAAIGAGIIKHPVLGINTANMWYTSVPTVLPTTAEQTSALSGLKDLSNAFAQSKDTTNAFYGIIKTNNPSVEGFNIDTPANMANYVEVTLKGADYLEISQAQWNKLKTYYETLTK